MLRLERGRQLDERGEQGQSVHFSLCTFGLVSELLRFNPAANLIEAR